MNENYVSIIALIIAVFFSGFYLKGERERKAEIMREIDLIRERQEAIKERVQAINREVAEKDSALAEKIELAESFIIELSEKDSMETAEIESLTMRIDTEKGKVDQIYTEIRSQSQLTLTSVSVDTSSSSQ